MPAYYLTTPIYYVNDAPHVGTAYTTVNADALARWHRLLGDDVWFMTGTDEHGAKIVEAAEANGVTPKEWTDRTSARFVEAWSRLDIGYDDFIRTTEPRHYTVVQEFLQRIYDNGFIELAQYSGLYCMSCEDYYTEDQLVDGKCPMHGRPVVEMQEDNYFFKLERVRAAVARLLRQPPDFVRPVSKRNEALGFIRGGLRDVSITRTSFTWGVPVPWDSGHVFYVWYDALINYLTVAGYGGDGDVRGTLGRGPPPPGQGHFEVPLRLVAGHVHGSRASSRRQEIFVHGYLLMGGQKLGKTMIAAGQGGATARRSTSPTCRRWPWPTTSASIRCAITCCARCRWAGTGTSPTRASWPATTRTWPTTSATWCRGSPRSSTRSAAASGPAPDPASELADEAAAVLEAATAAWERWAPHEALEETWRLIGAANAELEAAEPWKMEPGPEVDAVLGDALEVLRIVAVSDRPAMPSTAAEIWRRIGVAGDPASARLPAAAAWGGYAGGAAVVKGDRCSHGARPDERAGSTPTAMCRRSSGEGEDGGPSSSRVLARARAAGIDRLVCIGTGLTTSAQAVAVARASAGAARRGLGLRRAAPPRGSRGGRRGGGAARARAGRRRRRGGGGRRMRARLLLRALAAGTRSAPLSPRRSHWRMRTTWRW